MMDVYEQLSLFSLGLTQKAEAICCMDGKHTTASIPEDWMKRLVPSGEYVVMVGAHPLVLRPVALRSEEIPEGHHYYHYLVGSRVYAGIFVGSETDA